MNRKHAILIIDDTPENLQVLGELLDRDGYEVLIASSGEQSFEIIKSPPPDLILLDIVMPGMNGYDICRRIKADPDLSMIPVIFISSLDIADQKIQAFREGAVDYITKPFYAEEVIARVQTHLQLTQIEALKREIVERKRSEEALKESERRFRTLIEGAPICIVMIRGIEYLYVNPFHALTFGFDNPEEIIGSSYIQRTTPEFQKKFAAISDKLSSGQINSAQLESIGIRKDGTQFPYICSISKLNFAEGEVFLSFGTDISERRQAGELKIQNEKMTMIAGLAAGVAHEINTPIGTIIQGIQNIWRRFSSNLVANKIVADELGLDLDALQCYMERREINNYMKHMRSAADRAAFIVSNMLQFSHHKVDSFQLAGINSIIDQSINLAATDYELQTSYNLKKISFTKDYDQTLPDIQINITEIEQVIINLIRNAAQAMFLADTPLPTITIGTSQSKNDVVITFRDNGPGMADDVLLKVFNPFFTTKDVGLGTGLGLSVSYGIITTNHGGRITAQSEPGKGACFTIHLPISIEGEVA